MIDITLKMAKNCPIRWDDYTKQDHNRQGAGCVLRQENNEMLLYIGTTNTTTGNPRRGWLRTTASGQPLGWIEEGYEGRGAIAGYDDGESIKITVSPAEYKRIKSMGQNAEVSTALTVLGLKTESEMA